MEYTVKKLGALAGISGRTLRFYDQIALLKPKRINSSGYRIYGEAEVDRLQQILFYRNLNLPLQEIKQILDAPDFDYVAALNEHYQQLLTQQQQLNRLIATVEKTLQVKRGNETMTDKEKFNGFKKELIEKNEAQYGSEIREKYGEKTVQAANQKMAGMSEEQYQDFVHLEKEMIAELIAAMKTGDATNEAAKKVAELHREWLMYTWSNYSKEAHRGLAEMYVADERFRAYYEERAGAKSAEFLRDAIVQYTK